MTFVKLWVEDRHLGEIVIDNGGKIEETMMCDHPRDTLTRDIDEVVDRVKASYGIPPSARLGDVKALGAAAAYVTATQQSMMMSQEELGQAILDRLAKEN